MLSNWNVFEIYIRIVVGMEYLIIFFEGIMVEVDGYVWFEVDNLVF